MRKNSSYNSVNQPYSSNNNLQSYVSQSVSQSSSSQPPKIDFSEYEKPSLSR